jgi:uncharacterized membrane protein YjjP (DUF1212 family)
MDEGMMEHIIAGMTRWMEGCLLLKCLDMQGPRLVPTASL